MELREAGVAKRAQVAAVQMDMEDGVLALLGLEVLVVFFGERDGEEHLGRREREQATHTPAHTYPQKRNHSNLINT